MFALTQVKIMKQRASFSEPQCRPKARLATRPLLSLDEAKALERTFRVLANGTRLRLLHALARHPGLPVTELANMIGMKPQAVSNQLQKLMDQGILSNVRTGLNIHYRIVDPCTMNLLDQGLCLAEDTWKRQSRLSPRRHRTTG